MRYAVIHRHRGEFALRLMCRVLDVSPAGYYASRQRPLSWHAVLDEVLLAHVRIAHQDSGATYGAPRVQRELQAEGPPVATSNSPICGRVKLPQLTCAGRGEATVLSTAWQDAPPLL